MKKGKKVLYFIILSGIIVYSLTTTIIQGSLENKVVDSKLLQEKGRHNQQYSNGIEKSHQQKGYIQYSKYKIMNFTTSSGYNDKFDINIRTARKEKRVTRKKENIYISRHKVLLKNYHLVLPFYVRESSRANDLQNLEVILNRTTWQPISARKNVTKLMKYGAKVSSSWQIFHNNINNYELYSEHDDNVDRLLTDLYSQPITGVAYMKGGSQIKLNLTLGDRGYALFKPKRPYKRHSDHLYYDAPESPEAEIAAFHLDRLLGFHRTPPTVGRRINITRDIFCLAQHEFAKTFFVSRAGNVCFYGTCRKFCKSAYSICGNPVMLEGSVQAIIGTEKLSSFHPWRRAYSRHRQALWEKDNNYCNIIKHELPELVKGRTLLDLTDMAMLDFIMGNDDRHQKVLNRFGGYPFHFDHGKGFWSVDFDDIRITAPVYQCCVIRLTTLKTLFKFYKSTVSLGQALKKSLSRDPISPLLSDLHYEAVDRRVKIILQIVCKCIYKIKDVKKVIINDGL